MEKVKLLLINPEYRNKAIVHFPLGLGYIAGSCKKEGIEVQCVDMNFVNTDTQHILEIIKNNDYHVVGIGGFSTQLKSSIELTNRIKKTCQDVKVIIGGVQVVGCEDFIMNSKVDILCTGESEAILPKLVHAIYENDDLSDIPSIIYRRSGEIVKSASREIIERLDDIPFPAYEIFNMEKYIQENYHSTPGRRTIDFICSRGCPYRCSYCVNSKNPTKARYRRSENILQEIQYLKRQYNINDFSFSDEIFTINKRKALEICEAIKSENITWITSTRADRIDDELLSTMKASGCRMLLVGFESGSEKILKSMDKRVSLPTYINAINTLRKQQIHFYTNFMIGMPEETEETINETEKFCIQNMLIYAVSYVTPFPGSKLYDEVKDKIQDEKVYLYRLANIDFSKSPLVNLTEMSTKRLIFLRNRVVVNTMTNIIKKRYNYFPQVLIKISCWIYIFIFNQKNPVVSKIIRIINKRVYSAFSE